MRPHPQSRAQLLTRFGTFQPRPAAASTSYDVRRDSELSRMKDLLRRAGLNPSQNFSLRLMNYLRQSRVMSNFNQFLQLVNQSLGNQAINNWQDLESAIVRGKPAELNIIIQATQAMEEEQKHTAAASPRP
jgi:hypothetical protein